MTTPKASSPQSRAARQDTDLPRKVLITGGAGFVGSNLAEHLLQDSSVHLRIFDDLSRAGVRYNLDWLRSLQHQGRLEVVRGDVRLADAVRAAVSDRTEVYHLAAQVAVTTSVETPRTDFEVNALGTFNVLEAARLSGRKPFLLFTSTNKVYGALHSTSVAVDGTSYRAVDKAFAGVNEQQAVDFHSPYGCSKGTADQYVRDYSRIYGIPTVVFRMSCIAGPRQFGNEDQGWVAHFLYSVLQGAPVTVYGDGFQVRDILHIQDLVDAMDAARTKRHVTAGQIYNVGGGMTRAASVCEMLRAIEEQTGRKADIRYSAVRPGDQPLYISDTGKLTADTGWAPRRSLPETLEAIETFWKRNRDMLQAHHASLQVSDLVPEEVA